MTEPGRTATADDRAELGHKPTNKIDRPQLSPDETKKLPAATNAKSARD